jgi:hypothetical protein
LTTAEVVVVCLEASRWRSPQGGAFLIRQDHLERRRDAFCDLGLDRQEVESVAIEGGGP